MLEDMVQKSKAMVNLENKWIDAMWEAMVDPVGPRGEYWLHEADKLGDKLCKIYKENNVPREQWVLGDDYS